MAVWDTAERDPGPSSFLMQSVKDISDVGMYCKSNYDWDFCYEFIYVELFRFS